MSAQARRYRFTVLSDPMRFSFPLDMLRYDACWPEHQADVSAIADPATSRFDGGKQTLVRLVSDSKPTPERWASYGWHVTTTERIPR